MALYRISLKKSAEKDLRRIPAKVISNLLDKIEGLSSEPRSRQSVKLTGTDSGYRLRVGDYRVIYEVDDKLSLVIVQYIRHRKDVYRTIKDK